MPGVGSRNCGRDGILKIIIVGQFTIDSITLPNGTHAADVFGGAGVYAAVGAAIWGSTVKAIGVVGRDYPETWLADLRAGGIDTRSIRRLRMRHKLLASMSYDRTFRRQNDRAEPNPATQSLSRVARAKRWATFSPKLDDVQRLWRWADAVHITGMPIHRQNGFLKFFVAREQPMTLDLPWPPKLYRPRTLPRVDLATAIFLSGAEMKGIFPGLSPAAVVERLRSKRARIVVIRRGARGSMVVDTPSYQKHVIPAFPTRVVDPTGAGDAYCGGFLVGLAETSDLESAGLYGAVSASFVIEGVGAAHALRFTRIDAENRLLALRAQLASLPARHTLGSGSKSR